MPRPFPAGSFRRAWLPRIALALLAASLAGPAQAETPTEPASATAGKWKSAKPKSTPRPAEVVPATLPEELPLPATASARPGVILDPAVVPASANSAAPQPLPIDEQAKPLSAPVRKVDAPAAAAPAAVAAPRPAQGQRPAQTERPVGEPKRDPASYQSVPRTKPVARSEPQQATRITRPPMFDNAQSRPHQPAPEQPAPRRVAAPERPVPSPRPTSQVAPAEQAAPTEATAQADAAQENVGEDVRPVLYQDEVAPLPRRAARARELLRGNEPAQPKTREARPAPAGQSPFYTVWYDENNLPINGGAPVTAGPAFARPGGALWTDEEASRRVTRAYARAEYLLWWNRGFHVPALATTSNNATEPVLGSAHTSVVIGDGYLGGKSHSDVRLTTGLWLVPNEILGIEGTMLGLGQTKDNQELSSSGTPWLARPYVNMDLTPIAPDTWPIAEPGVGSGSIAVNTSTELRTGDLMLRGNLAKQGDWRIDGLAGYRFLQLKEDLSIYQTSRLLVATPDYTAGTQFNFTDQILTKNTFHGAQIGFASRSNMNRMSLELTGKLAMGVSMAHSELSGNRATTDNTGATRTYSRGVLVQATNAGSLKENNFAVMPELGATLGLDVTERLRATVGYTFLYISNVARPGDQLDLDISGLTIYDGTASATGRPRPDLRTSDFWTHGLNVGLEYSF